MNEIELKAQLERWFSPHFIMKREVRGHFLVDNTPVVIDYLMRPKADLTARGFIDDWFGVEVKAPGTYSDSAKRGLQVAWQGITYSQSEFDGKRPAFVLLYPHLSAFFVNGPRSEGGTAQSISCMLQKANVGFIELNKKRTHGRSVAERLVISTQKQD